MKNDKRKKEKIKTIKISMNNKKIYLILIILLILAVGLLGVFWYLATRNTKQLVIEESINNVATTTETTVETPVAVVDTKPIVNYNVTEEEKDQAQLLKFAGSFVERYASYSNQTDYENLTDLIPFMSVSLKNWANNFVAEKRKNVGENQPYYGITTKTLKKELLSYTDDLVKIKVSTQRSEMVGADFNAKVFYEDFIVELIKEAGVWKVNSVGK